MIDRTNIAAILKSPNPFEISYGKLLPARSILVLSPHPDDEVLGCGGIISAYRHLGAACTIIYLTDGRYGGTVTRVDRIKEALSIKSILNGIEQMFWNLPDSGLHREIELVTCFLKRIIIIKQPDIIFTPWIIDSHLDHESTSIALAMALVDLEFSGAIALYEVMSPLCGNYLFNISTLMETKNELMRCYASQVNRYRVDKISKCLNSFRAIASRRNMMSAECFLVFLKDRFLSLVDQLYR